MALAGVKSNRAKNQALPKWLILPVFKSALTSWMIVFKRDFLLRSCSPKARLLTRPHMLMFLSIATPQ